jgi:putative ABC transport system substrate-binding protein
MLIAGTSANAADSGAKRVAILTMVDTPQLLEVKDGIVAGLAQRGYVDGKNLQIDFKSAQGNFGTAQQIARQFVGDAPDVIVTITTPTSQAVVQATKDIPIVFTTVTDPLKAKIVSTAKAPGGNVTGISDFVPTEPQIHLIREIVPKLRTLGLVYDPSLDNSRSTVEAVKALAEKEGFKIVESPAMGLNEVAGAGQNLVGKVDAMFVPNDTTVYAGFEALVKVAQDAKVPLFTAERRSVQRGSIGTVGYDFGDMGRATAGLVDDIFKGKKPGDMDIVYMKDVPNALSLYLNKTSADKMGVEIPDPVLKRAAKVF